MSFFKSIWSAIVSAFTPKSTTASPPSMKGWQPAWTETLRELVRENLDALSSASDILKLHPKYGALNTQQRTTVWAEFFKALAYYESSFDPNSASVDVGVKGKPDTYSIGLLQLSVVDQANLGIRLGLDFDGLLKPDNNLKLGVLIMVNQIKKRGKIFIPKGEKGNPGVYWARINPGNRYDKTAEITAAVHKLDFSLATPDPQPAPAPVNENTPWMDIINKDIADKVGEIPGPENHPVIVAAHQAAGLARSMWNDLTAWCASYGKYTFIRAGVKPERLKNFKAWARDYLRFGVKLTAFRYGCLMVFERNGPGGDSHVTFGVRVEYRNGKKGYLCKGGNQSNKVCEAWYPESDLLGMRWPSDDMLRDMGAL